MKELVVHRPLFRNCIVDLWSKRMMTKACFDVLVKILMLLMLLVEVHFWVLFIHLATIATHRSRNSSLLPEVVIRMLSVETHASKGSVGGLSCQFDKVAAGKLSGGERVDEGV